jgi:hypothetical protein
VAQVRNGGEDVNLARPFRVGAGLVGAGMATWGAYSAITWARYGRAQPERRPRDALLDRFIPEPEVDEYHSFQVRAPAAITFASAKDLDLQASPLVRSIFWLRAIPSTLRGTPFRPEGPRSILEETLASGWGVLAEEPDHEIVVGAYTQPWHEDVVFHALPPEDFAAFNEPGNVKIVWTLGAEPLGEHRSLFVTRTRVQTTDQDARRHFRLYWAPMSAGIILIRYLSLPMVRREAERRASSLQAREPIADAES